MNNLWITTIPLERLWGVMPHASLPPATGIHKIFYRPVGGPPVSYAPRVQSAANRKIKKKNGPTSNRGATGVPDQGAGGRRRAAIRISLTVGYRNSDTNPLRLPDARHRQRCRQSSALYAGPNMRGYIRGRTSSPPRRITPDRL